MEAKIPSWTLSDIATLVGGTAVNECGGRYTHPTSIDSPDPEGVTFAENAQFLVRAAASDVGAVLVPLGTADFPKPHVLVDSPRRAFGVLLAHAHQPLALPPGIHASAHIDATAKVDPNASIGPLAHVGPNSEVHAGARIHGLAYVGESCVVGENSTVYPSAVLVQMVRIGKRCLIFPGAVIGSDGFGYAWDGTKHAKVPQVGGVELGDDVEIGANTTIDRATAGWTRIASGTKIDNLVQIAHNVQIGDHGMIASQVGIAGSTKLGRGVVMAGQAATVDHVNIGDGVIMGARAGATKDIPAAGTYWGVPAEPLAENLRYQAMLRKVPELFARIKALEEEIERLKQ